VRICENGVLVRANRSLLFAGLFCMRTEFCVSPPGGKHIFQGNLQYVSMTRNEDRDTVLCGPLHLVADARQLLVTVGAA